MRNIPVDLSQFMLIVGAEPVVKTFKDKQGKEQISSSRETGQTYYTLELYTKRRATMPGEKTGKGEVVKVTLTNDPPEGIYMGQLVELIMPDVSFYNFTSDEGKEISGFSFRAAGLKPATAPAKSKTPAA